MISYQIYKIIHIASIVLFFALYMSAAVKGKGKPIKKEVIFSGLALILVLVSGMGLIARLGIPHDAPWPLWLKGKLVIWAVIGVVGHAILKRFAQYRLKFFWFGFILLICASTLANYKF